MIALVIALALGQRIASADASDQARVDATKSVLSMFDVPGPLVVVKTQAPDPRYMSGGVVILKDRAGQLYTAYFRKSSDEPISVFRGKERDGMSSGSHIRSNDPKFVQRLRTWADRFRGEPTVRLVSAYTEDRIVRAEFFVLIHGYPILVPFGTSGFSLILSPIDGRFLALRVWDPPPPVDPRRASLSETDAVRAFKRVFDSQIAPPAWTERHMKLSYRLTGPNVLGYFLWRGQNVAHLAWEIPYVLLGDTSAETKHSSLDTMLIDAITGNPALPIQSYARPSPW